MNRKIDESAMVVFEELAVMVRKLLPHNHELVVPVCLNFFEHGYLQGKISELKKNIEQLDSLGQKIQNYLQDAR